MAFKMMGPTKRSKVTKKIEAQVTKKIKPKKGKK
jgi:hypothetical protein